ncbi:MAG: DUF2087 domain-containing protein [Coprothermobacterota bacterium]|nr:DUF2087 domain-containing protein [Coprothermobacterota bacterium]
MEQVNAEIPKELRHYLDGRERLKVWPGRQKRQRLAILYLAGKFDSRRDYTEREVNELLLQWHTFADVALLRRLMFDWGFLGRTIDGARYWRMDPDPEK